MVVPSDWEVARLGDLADVRTGPFGSALHASDYVTSGTPIITVEHLGRFRLHGDEAPMVADDDRDRLSKYLLRDGDIVFSRVGSIGRFGLVTDAEEGWLFSGRLLRVRLKRDYAPFVYHQMCTTGFIRQIESVAVGQTMPSLNTVIVNDLLVALPSLREQRAIAEALSDADALVESLDALIAKKRDMKQAAMQQLLTGRTRLPGFTDEWQTRQFAELCSPRSSRIDPRVSGGGDFCVELEHLESGTARLLGSGLTTESSSLKTKFTAGDVLFGKLRSYLRKSWLADRSGVCSTEIWVLAASPDVSSPRFLAQVVQTDRFVEASSMSYGTHMPRSDWSIVSKHELAAPSLPEQEAIGTVLMDMDAEIDALVAQREKAELVKQGMMQELLSGRVRLA